MTGNWQSFDDFGFTASDLDGRYVVEFFRGLDQEQARKTFQSDATRYFEYLMLLSGAPFRFYFAVVVSLLRDTPSHSWNTDIIFEFLGAVSWKICYDVDDVAEFKSELLIICDAVDQWELSEQHDFKNYYRIPRKVDRLRSALKAL